MYQTAGSEIVKTLVEECIGVPCIHYQRRGRSLDTSLVYNSTNNDTAPTMNTTTNTTTNNYDEVEDLYYALVQAKQQYPIIEAVCSGAILSTYQRIRIEEIVCNRLQLVSLAYLWRKSSQLAILLEMIEEQGMEIAIVRVAAPPGLVPRQHLYNPNKQNIITTSSIQYFQQLYKQYRFHICGEGGEYETIVLYCPKLFSKTGRRFVIDQVRIIESPDDDGTGSIQILKYHTESVVDSYNNDTNDNNNDNDNETTIATTNNSISEQHPVVSSESEAAIPTPTESNQNQHSNLVKQSTASLLESLSIHKSIHYSLPNIRYGTGGFITISEISCPIPIQSLTIQEEFTVVLNILHSTLNRISCTAQDVIKVYVYLSQISLFGTINSIYQKFFGTVLPPSRCCIALGTGVMTKRIILDCWIQQGSGQYLRRQSHSNANQSNNNNNNNTPTDNPYYTAALVNQSTQLRRVLHVQSRSYWAPVCVGPYSQVNTIRDCCHCIAGQIGLVPQSMILPIQQWEQQLYQLIRNTANLLDALDSISISSNILSGLLYITDTVYYKETLNNSNKEIFYQKLQSMCREYIQNNGGVIPGIVDGLNPIPDDDDNDNNLYNGYEDEGTMIEEMQRQQQKNNNSTSGEDSSNNSDCICPLLVVIVSELPVGALIEMDLTASTQRAVQVLQRIDTHRRYEFSSNDNLRSSSITKIRWDTGHDVIRTTSKSNSSYDPTIHIDSHIRSLGSRSMSFATVTATISQQQSTQDTMDSTKHNNRNQTIDTIALFQCMIRSILYDSIVFDMHNLVQIRFYYVATTYDKTTNDSVPINDGIEMRSNFYIACASELSKLSVPLPAITVLPVHEIGLLFGRTINNVPPTISNNGTAPTNCDTSILYAFQAVSFDPVHTETNIWIHQKR